MGLYALLAITLIVIYGLLTAFAAFQQFKSQMIQPWAAIGMFCAALALLGAGFLLGEGSQYTLPVLLVGLAALHALAVVNGKHMHGKINWRHHLLRGVLSLTLIAMTVLGLGS